MNKLTYFAPPYSSIEEVEERYGPILDSTSLQKLADCPRYYEIRVVRGLDSRAAAPARMAAGIAIHAGLEYFYSFPAEARTSSAVRSMAIAIAIDEWTALVPDRALMEPESIHLSADHISSILENYFSYWGYHVIEVFEPLHLTVDDLDLSNVLAARFALNSDGALLLGESNLIMRFDLPGSLQPLIFSGKPDLPVADQLGNLHVMDHKTTSSYLSDYWAREFSTSNKMRLYMAMVRSLLGRTPVGAVINGIYVGKYATVPSSKATRFTRYTYDFTPEHIDEALLNWQAWLSTAAHYASTGYYPQGCGFGGCRIPSLCRRDPATREDVILTDFAPSTREFWNL